MNEEQKQLYLDALYFHLLREGYSKWLAEKKVEHQRKMMSGEP